MFDQVLMFCCIVIRSCVRYTITCLCVFDEIEFPTCDSHRIPCFVVTQVTFYFIYNPDVNGISEVLRYDLLEVLLWYLFCLHSLSDCVRSSSMWNTSPRNEYSVPSWLTSLEGYIHTYIIESQHWNIEPYIAFTYTRSGVCRKFKNVAWASH